MKLLFTAGLVGASFVCLVSQAEAQVQPNRLQVTPTVGWLQSDDAAALSDPAMVGIEVAYYPIEYVGFGFSGNYARAESDGSFFPAMRWDVGPDTTRLLHVGQDLTILTYSGVAKVGLQTGRFAPYGVGGLGGWTFLLDPQSNDRPTRASGLLVEFGGGLHVAVTERVGLRLDVRDIMFGNYDRDELYPVSERFQSDIFLVPQPPAKEGTAHNLRFSLGFSYLVGG